MAFDLVTLKKSFFDRKSVADKVDPALKRILSRFGAFVRRRDQTSIKYGKGTAAPGKPPVAHRSRKFTRKKKSKGVTTQQPVSPLRELIFFGYDHIRHSVVIGPVRYGKNAARVIEEGGNGHQPHPHTGPAFKAELAKVGNDFRNCIK